MAIFVLLGYRHKSPLESQRGNPPRRDENWSGLVPANGLPHGYELDEMNLRSKQKLFHEEGKLLKVTIEGRISYRATTSRSLFELSKMLERNVSQDDYWKISNQKTNAHQHCTKWERFFPLMWADRCWISRFRRKAVSHWSSRSWSVALFQLSCNSKIGSGKNCCPLLK